MAYCCQTLKCAEALLLCGGGLFKCLVLLNQILNLIDGVSQLGGEQIWLLGDKPSLGNGSISGKLVDLQN